MFLRSCSDRAARAALLSAAVLAWPAALAAQEATASRIVSSQIAVSRDEAVLELELEGDREFQISLDESGGVLLNGERIGRYERRDELDRSWRELLTQAIDAPYDELRRMLVDWQPPTGGVAGRIDRELEATLAATAPAPVQSALPPASRASDSIARLNERIAELEAQLDDDFAPAAQAEATRRSVDDLRREIEREIRHELQRELRGGVRDSFRSPFRHIMRGLGGIVSTLMVYALLVGIGFLTVYFGRRYLEGVADTARQATLRSGLVGLAGSFLVLPAFVLGILALAISIVGIPLLLVFVPLFPVAVALAALLGYLAVAHAAGESLAERRFTGSDWFTRANSYYYILTGVGLLLVLFVAVHVVEMAGPWLGFLEGLLAFFAGVVTWAAFTVGFGAVLISRAGTQPARGATGAPDLEADLQEETHV